MQPLLRILARNSHTPLPDIAKELAVSEAEVRRQIAELEASGVILGYQAIIDAEKAGDRSVTALIEIKITPERGGGFDRLGSRIAQFEQVERCCLMSGGFDLLVVVRGNDLRDIASFVSEKLSTIQGVLSTATLFQLKTYKDNGILIHREQSPPRLAVAP